MNYQKCYLKLIESRKSLNRNKGDGNYYEKHHIIPKACGGSNNKENLILLTFKEHYIAHLLLTKIYEGELRRKMYYALWQMSRNILNGERILSASQFDKCKEAEVLAKKGRKVSDEVKERLREINTGKTISEEQRRKISETLTGSKQTEEIKEKIRKYQTGRPKSEKTKEKIREAKRLNPYKHSEETRRKISEKSKGRKPWNKK